MARAISEHTIPLQINSGKPTEADRAVIARFRQVWTPTIMLVSAEGVIDDQWQGYLPPSLFLPQLMLSLGKVLLKNERFADAAALFRSVADLYPAAPSAPEALYWVAVAAYRGSGKPDDLMGGWARLRAAYPTSEWRVKQSFIEG